MSDETGPMRPIEFYILLALCRGETHGYGIIGETERQSDGAVKLDPGTLYRAIGRLGQAGLLSEVSRREATDLDQRRRRYYAITPAGRDVAAREARRMSGLVQAAVDSDLIGGPESV
jgi:DNA-binding PadR family transcriptional regulator